MVEIKEKPETVEGKRIVDAIVQTAIKNAEEKGPCKFLAYKGKILGKDIEVYAYESDKDAKLLGPASLNTIYVYNGNILGIPEKGLENEELVVKAREKGVSTGIRYLDAFASYTAYQIENMVKKGETGEKSFRVKIVKNPSDINVKIAPPAERYITSKNKKIMVKCPTFLGVKVKISP